MLALENKDILVIGLGGRGRPVPRPIEGRNRSMVTFGVDAHKRTHTIVVIDDHGKPLGQTTIGTTSKDHLGLVQWAARFGAERRWD